MSIPQGGPIAKAAFLALFGVHFFAQTLLLGQIASLCPSLGFNQRLKEASVALCIAAKNHNLVQTANSRAVDLKIDAVTRSLQA